MTLPDDRASSEADAATRITLLGAGVDAVLGGGKIVVGVGAGSHALVADGIHSLTDLVTDAGVLVVARMARARPDPEHPYGHGRFETLASLVLGAVLLLVAGALAQDSFLRLLDGDSTVPGALALLAAAISIAAKEWIFRATRRVATRIGSNLLMANAWHSRSDALSSVAVLVGVAGAMAGWAWCDLAAAIAVAALIGWVGWDLIADAARELVDTGLPEDVRARVGEAAAAVPGVRGVHHLRSRRMGSAVLVDLDVEVGSRLSVSEGHRIATAVSDRLVEGFSEITAVNVHVDPVRVLRRAPAPRVDVTAEPPGDAPDQHLPLRAEAEARLRARLPPIIAERLEGLTLHYRETGIEVEFFLGELQTADPTQASMSAADAEHERTSTVPSPSELLARLRMDGLLWLQNVRIWTAHRDQR